MARALRPRKSRPSYASYLDSDNEAPPADAGSSSDDFQPPNGQGENEDAGDEVSDGVSSQGDDPPPDNDDENGDEDVLGLTSTPVTIPKKRKVASSNTPRVSGLSTTRSRTGNRSFKVALSNSDHRQRPDPLYWRAARVERLTEPPLPFKPSLTTSTNSWNFDKTCTDRYLKATGYNIGRGPIWELMEDRSWWKESHIVDDGQTETEATKRPKVYREGIMAGANIEIIDEQEAIMYLPTDNEPSNESVPSSITCSFGIPGKTVKRELRAFNSINMAEYLPDSKAHVFFAGGPVWGIDWCPIHVEDQPYRSYKQYIAVSTLPSRSHTPYIGQKCSTPLPACIQIWSYSPCQPLSAKGKDKESADEGDFGKMACELVLCFDCGPAQEIKWCPLPSNDSWMESTPDNVRKLGLLAGACEDGSLCIFAIPDPDDLRSNPVEGPIFTKIKPVIRIELEETSIWSLDWANSERIAVGCTNGSIAIYDIKNALTIGSLQDIELLPTHYFATHQSAIRTVQWVPIPRTAADGSLGFDSTPALLASGGFDGCEILTDLKDGRANLLNRTRDVVLAMTYSRHSEGVVTIDLDYIVKSFSMSPSILGRGTILIEAGGPVWSLGTSDYHPNLALGSADGSVLTTNILRSTRRSTSTPFLFYKIFQVDYDRKSGEYRMLEQFLPQELPDRPSAAASKKGKKGADEDTSPSGTGVQGTGVWASEVSVTRVAWNNGGGLARAPLLASATASGLCRIDWLIGFFQNGKVPYESVENIRKEGEAVSYTQDDDDD